MADPIVNPVAPAAPLAEGQKLYMQMRQGGVAQKDAEAWKSNLTHQMLSGGVSQADVDKYWGDVPPDTSGIDAATKDALGKPGMAEHAAKGPWQAIEAGWQNSDIGMMVRGQKANLNTEDDGAFYQALGDATSTLADLPIYAGGFLGGAAAAGAAGIETGPGDLAIAPIAGFASANMLHSTIRHALIQQYSHPNGVTNFRQFGRLFTQSLVSTLKAGVSGAAMGAGGEAAAPVVSKLPGILGKPAEALAQTIAGTAATDAMDRKVPSAGDFVSSAIVATGLGLLGAYTPRPMRASEVEHDVVAGTANNLRTIYDKTGVDPRLLAHNAPRNGPIHSDILGPTNSAGDVAAPTILMLEKPDPEPPKAANENPPKEGEAPAPESEQERFYRPRTLGQVIADANTPEAIDRTLTAQGDGGGWEPPVTPWKPSNDNEEPEPDKLYLGTDHMQLNEHMLAQRILDHVVPPPKEGGVPAWLNPRTWLAQFQSRLTPAHEIDRTLEKEGLLAPDQMGVEDMLRQTFGSAERAAYFLHYGILNASFDHLSDASYQSAMKAVRDDGGTANDFMAYRLAKRTVQRARDGIETGIPVDEARAYLAKPGVDAKYARGHAILGEVKRGIVNYARESGLLTPEAAKGMNDLADDHIVMRRLVNKDYVPDMPGSARNLGVRNPFRKQTGGEQPIIDPATTEIDNLHTIIAMADHNRAIGNVIGAIEEYNRHKGSASKLGLMKLEQPTADLQKRIGDEPALEGDLIGADGKPVKVTPEEAKATAPFLASRRFNGNRGPNDFIYYRNGKPEVWRAADPDLADLMRLQWPGKTNPIAQFFIKVASLSRLGITGSPSFPLRAILHGQLSSAAMDKYGQNIPYHDVMLAMADVFHHGEAYKRWMAHGGGGALTDMDRNTQVQDMMRLFDRGGVNGAVWNTVKHPIEAMRMMQHLTDAAARVGYMKRLESMGAPTTKAVTLSRKAYLDFGEPLAASWANTFARMVPFMTVSLKAMEQIGEGLTPGRIMGTLLKAGAILTAPTYLNFAANMVADQYLPAGQKYLDYPQWERDMYWILPPIRGVRIKIKRPYEAGFLFATVPERMMTWAWTAGKSSMEQGLMHTLVQQYLPPVAPTFPAPIVEQWANRSLYTGNALVPGYLETVSGWLQFKPSTSKTARDIARYLGPPGLGVTDMSPIVLQNYIDEWGGTLPMELLRIVEGSGSKLTGAPVKDFANIPFVGAFIARRPDMNASEITGFYNSYDDVKYANADLRAAMASGDPQELADTNKPLAYVDVSEIHKSLTNITKLVQAISNDPKMSAVEKRQVTDSLVAGAVQIAHYGNEVVTAVKASIAKGKVKNKAPAQ